MGAPIPCFGYPSRTQAVLAMRGGGMTTKEIAAAIGITTSVVVALEIGSSRPRREPADDERLGRTIVLPVDVLDALRPHAARRNVSANHLARVIISTVVDEKMIDAVLDDADALDGSE